MKQAKFALTAIAVLAVVGGALAFKAARTANAVIYTNGASQCTVSSVVAGYTVTQDFVPTTQIPNASTTTKASLCTTPAILYRAD